MNPKTFFWNVRGLNNPDKHHTFTQWLNTTQPLIGAILESHIKEPNLNQVMGRACPGWKFTTNHDTNDDGRIILIWKEQCSVQVLHQSKQSLTSAVTLPGGYKFTFSAVYACNNKEERVPLWEELLEIQQTLFLENTSWLIGGDLNQILHFNEHSKDSVNHLSEDMIELKDFLRTLGVDDLRFQGCSHTWTNKRPEDPITKKLDRALVNANWSVS